MVLDSQGFGSLCFNYKDFEEFILLILCFRK